MPVCGHTAFLYEVLRSHGPQLGEHVVGLRAVSGHCKHTYFSTFCSPMPYPTKQSHMSDSGAVQSMLSLSGENATTQSLLYFILFEAES